MVNHPFFTTIWGIYFLFVSNQLKQIQGKQSGLIDVVGKLIDSQMRRVGREIFPLPPFPLVHVAIFHRKM